MESVLFLKHSPCELGGEAYGQLRELGGVGHVHVLEGVTGSVDVGVVLPERRLERKGSGVAVAVEAGVVAAPVPAPAVSSRDGEVSVGEGADEVVLGRVGVVGDHANARVAVVPSGHVELQHTSNLHIVRSVLSSDVLTAPQAHLLRCVGLELDRAGGFEVAGHQGAERLQHRRRPARIVVRARGGGGGEDAGDGVDVTTQDNELIRLGGSLQPHDKAGLLPRVLELPDRNIRGAGCRDRGLVLVRQPLHRLRGGVLSVVAVVVGRQVRHVLTVLFLVQVLNSRLHEGLVRGPLRGRQAEVHNLLPHRGGVLVIRDVDEGAVVPRLARLVAAVLGTLRTVCKSDHLLLRNPPGAAADGAKVQEPLTGDRRRGGRKAKGNRQHRFFFGSRFLKTQKRSKKVQK
eukprot:Hpha_TRINITY_DN15616_c3_g7::TRINITY_DN15616_c3_g7_i1::g.101692::m.101692